MNVQERRKCRSQYTGNALNLWLSAVAARSGLEGFVLTDSHGLVVAASLYREDADELAVAASMLASLKAGGSTIASKVSLPLAVESVSVDGGVLTLCAIGDRAHSDQGLNSAWAGVRRILDTTN
jgi:hypothetical protein